MSSRLLRAEEDWAASRRAALKAAVNAKHMLAEVEAIPGSAQTLPR